MVLVMIALAMAVCGVVFPKSQIQIGLGFLGFTMAWIVLAALTTPAG